MTGVSLRLDQTRWREHLQTVLGATPGLVPVAKGNGYGYGLRRLAEESAALGVDTIAVGTADEVAAVRDVFPGDIVVLTPWRPDNVLATELASDPRIITTVSRLEDLAALATDANPPRVLVEVLTSMRRHGIPAEDLAQVVSLLGKVQFEGWTIHLPLLAAGRYVEAERLARTALQASAGPLWLSHLPPEEAMALARQLGGANGDPVPFRLRVGTRLWLGDERTRSTTATVLDVHRIKRGERAGYRQRVVPADGWIIVVAGGTSHGIGLEAPTSASNVRQRVIAFATGSLEAAGLALSPYTVNGSKRWFLEPPHMQSSLLFLPRKETPPLVGDELPVELRLTTATVDHIVTE
ncbi:alanine racemase [Microlunatus panaciterrae]|uniref:Alanine racemase n=1 Tax=Microlunatus panaciterrae TaxID=400768 RepID=A0ABS2RKA6_9ACTN|nr:alanine racemase [Microlunatus panaciterrae]